MAKAVNVALRFDMLCQLMILVDADVVFLALLTLFQQLRTTRPTSGFAKATAADGVFKLRH